MGCILYELATGTKAFQNDYATLQYKGAALELPLDEYFSTQCREIVAENIARMLKVVPASRPSVRQLLKEFSRDFENIRTVDDKTRSLNTNTSNTLRTIKSKLSWLKF